MSTKSAIATMLMVHLDHLTPAERQRMADGELAGCNMQDENNALALIYHPSPGDDAPSLDGTGYSPERWAIEMYARSLGCTWVLWEPDGYVLDGFPTPSAPKGDAP